MAKIVMIFVFTLLLSACVLDEEVEFVICTHGNQVYRFERPKIVIKTNVARIFKITTESEGTYFFPINSCIIKFKSGDA